MKKSINITNNFDHNLNDVIDYLVGSDNLEEMIKRAEDGDVHAANAILASIAHYLHPLNNMEVPLIVRDYLSKAFYKMANGAKSQDALNLSRSGRPNYSHKLKVTVAYLVYQLVNEQKHTVLEASALAAEIINNKLSDGRFYELNNNPISEDTTRNWYIELKNYIQKRYELAKNTLNP